MGLIERGAHLKGCLINFWLQKGGLLDRGLNRERVGGGAKKEKLRYIIHQSVQTTPMFSFPQPGDSGDMDL